MARGNPIEHQTNADQADEDAAAVETDWSAVSAEVTSGAPAGDAKAQPYIHQLQARVEAVLSGQDIGADAVGDIWSPRKRLAFFIGASTLCWALILLPIML